MLAIRPISEELKKVCKDELNEVEDRMQADVLALRTWIQQQPHLRACTEDQFLINFLRTCKYSLEKVKTSIDALYTLQSLWPEMLMTTRLEDKIIELIQTGAMVYLPNPLGTGGPRIQFTNYAKIDAKKFSSSDVCHLQFHIAAMLFMEDDNTIINGYVQIMDFEKINFGLLKTFDPIIVKKLSVCLKKINSIRIKGIHVINSSKEIQTILAICRGFLPEKIKKRFFIHKNMNELYKHIPQEYLPIEYGGTNGSLTELPDQITDCLVKFTENYQHHSQYGVDENLRVGKNIAADELFGLEGSFRKLDID